jgi:hypothetical protein
MRLVADERLRRRIAASAQAHVRTELSLDQAVDAWRQLLQTMLPAQGTADKAVMAAFNRKLKSAELRAERLEAQVVGLKAAAQQLLLSQSPKLGRSFVDRVIRRLLRYRRGLVPLPATGTTHAARALVASNDEETTLVLSGNLQHVPYLEYEVGHVEREGSILRIPVVATVPYLDGSFGIELVDPQDAIVAHLTQRIAHLGADLVAIFPVGNVYVEGRGWRLRVFARESVSPIFVHEHAVRGRSECVFELVAAEAGGKVV